MSDLQNSLTKAERREAKKRGPSMIPHPERFFMVMCEDAKTPAPTVRHRSHPKALREAYRLARAHGKAFFVLKAENVARPEHPRPEEGA